MKTKRKWSWWRAWLVQIAEMLLLGIPASLTEVLGAFINGAVMWVVVPILGAISAYRATQRGLNNYLAWLAPPICTVAVHVLIWTYFPDAGTALFCALISLIGAAAGEVVLREKERERKDGKGFDSDL